METKFRPIPVTILDLLAVLLPGFVWVVLLVITSQLLLDGQSPLINSPTLTLRELGTKGGAEISWLPVILCIIVASLLIGYSLKPIAMRLAEMLSVIFFKRQKKYREIPLRKLKYPFKEIYKDTDYYRQICALIRENLKCSPEELHGHQPFSAAKRYLRLMAPTLWEESERMEAEVRMTGMLFLAALYSAALSGSILFLQAFGRFQNSFQRNLVVWFALSILMTLILAESFNYLRVREVGYTYINALIASKFKTPVASVNADAKEE